MLDDFKYQAKKAVVAAQEAARDMGHDHIGTEHLLLGLQRQPSPVKQALESLGLTDAQVTQQLEDIFGIGPATTDAIPFDPEANAAFDRADEEAAELGQERVGAEHLMFALLDQPESGAVKMLQKMDVDPAAVRPAVVNALQGANDGPSLDEADDLKGDRKPEYRPASKEIGAILVDNGAIDQERLNQALEGARDKLLGRALIENQQDSQHIQTQLLALAAQLTKPNDDRVLCLIPPILV
jgi:ATP-dependent Clp protease ATP-binding subunit ClpC